MASIVKLLIALHLLTSTKTDVFLVGNHNVNSVTAGMVNNAHILLTPAHLEQNGVALLVKAVALVEMVFTQDLMENVILYHNSALQISNGMVADVLQLVETFAPKEHMLKEINVSHMKHVKMDLSGMQTI